MNAGTKQPVINSDILAAERNWIGFTDGQVSNWFGDLAARLMRSSDFLTTPFAFSVWELTGDYYDWRTDAAKSVSLQTQSKCAS